MYKLARERIFGSSEENTTGKFARAFPLPILLTKSAADAETDNGMSRTSSMSANRSNLGKRGKPGKQRRDSDSFDTRHQYTPYWGPQQQTWVPQPQMQYMPPPGAPYGSPGQASYPTPVAPAYGQQVPYPTMPNMVPASPYAQYPASQVWTDKALVLFRVLIMLSMFHRPRNNHIRPRRAQCQHTHRRCLQAHLHRAGRAVIVHQVLMLPEVLRKAVFLMHSASCRPMRTPMTRRASIRSLAATTETTVSTQRLSHSFLEGRCHQLIHPNLHSPPRVLITAVPRSAHHIWLILATSRQCHSRLTDLATPWLGKDLTHPYQHSTALSNTHLTRLLAPQCKARHHSPLLLRTTGHMASKGRVIRRTAIYPCTATRQASPRSQRLEFRRCKHRKWKHEAYLICRKSVALSAYMVWIIITLALNGYGNDEGLREKTEWMLPGFQQIYHRDDKKHHINVYTQIKTVS